MSKRFVAAETAYAKAPRPQGTLLIQGMGSQGWWRYWGGAWWRVARVRPGRALSTMKGVEILF